MKDELIFLYLPMTRVKVLKGENRVGKGVKTQIKERNTRGKSLFALRFSYMLSGGILF